MTSQNYSSAWEYAEEKTQTIVLPDSVIQPAYTFLYIPFRDAFAIALTDVTGNSVVNATSISYALFHFEMKLDNYLAFCK